MENENNEIKQDQNSTNDIPDSQKDGELSQDNSWKQAFAKTGASDFLQRNMDILHGSYGTDSGAATANAWQPGYTANPFVAAANAMDSDAKDLLKRNRPQTEETKRMRENFSFFGPKTLLYAVFYAFCMYQNDAGIAFLFFIIATLVYLNTAMKKLDRKLDRHSAFYMAGMLLLAVSTFCTDDKRIIGYNKTGIFLLMISMLLRQFYQTEQWGLGKYLLSILTTTFGALEELLDPVEDALDYVETAGKDTKKMKSVLMGLAVAFPLILLITGLLSDADIFFRQLTTSAYMSIDERMIGEVIFRTLIVFFSMYMLIAYLCRHTIKEEVKDRRTGEPVLAITVMSMLTMIYIVFSGIQIFGLFLGKLQLPEEYTYAQYAREGFFQLLAVSAINLVLVLVCLSFFKNNRTLKGLLTVMSLCTFVMIASSAMRMILYIQTYDLTFQRILVLWALGVLTCIFKGVLCRIYKDNFPLFRYGVVVVTVLYLGLSFSHPDYIIASVNVQKESVDYAYLETLCADAAPVLTEYIRRGGYTEVTENCKPRFYGHTFIDNIRRKESTLGIRTFNVSRYIAAYQCRGL